jgi:hypothetical protein
VLCHPAKGSAGTSFPAAFQLFASFCGREPFIFELRRSDGFTLNVGADEPVGFVENRRTAGAVN